MSILSRSRQNHLRWRLVAFSSFLARVTSLLARTFCQVRPLPAELTNTLLVRLDVLELQTLELQKRIKAHQLPGVQGQSLRSTKYKRFLHSSRTQKSPTRIEKLVFLFQCTWLHNVSWLGGHQPCTRLAPALHRCIKSTAVRASLDHSPDLSIRSYLLMITVLFFFFSFSKRTRVERSQAVDLPDVACAYAGRRDRVVIFCVCVW